MKNGRFSDAQIMGILKQAEGGVPVSELCREHGMSSASFYKWRAKYGGMDASMISELKDMADQNKRLKKMYAELSMQNDLDLSRKSAGYLSHLCRHAFKRERAFTA
jgi:putative transposase